MKIDPHQWWPRTYDGQHVRHTECGGWLYYRCDEQLRILETACDRCNPGFQEVQLNLFDQRS